MGEYIKVVPLLDYSKVKEGDPCPHNDGGIFKRIGTGEGLREYLVCSVDKDHCRWPHIGAVNGDGKIHTW